MLHRITSQIDKFYNRYRFLIEDVIMPLALLIWPLVMAAQGVDVSDSTYSPGNYMFPDTVGEVWLLSTYLSNLIGEGILLLPGADTLFGLNIYTGLIISATALVVYYGLRRDFNPVAMWLGEILAINLNWCPKGILYNTLTYFFFTAAAVLIFKAIKGRNALYLVTAGICLDINVFVRIPNVLEVALILALWGTLIYMKADRKEVLRLTMSSILGFTIGILIPLILLIATHGLEGIRTLVTGLFDMSSSDEEYTFATMLVSTARAYLKSSKWMLLILALIFGGTLVMAAVKSKPIFKNIWRVLFIGFIALMLRFMWGRGMYAFTYYEHYTSIFQWGMMVLMIAIAAAVVVLASSKYNVLSKSLALLTLMIILITPLGSNNYTMQNLNNMFIVCPFVFYVLGGWLNKGIHRLRLTEVLYGCNFPWMSTLIVLVTFVLIHTSLFHVNFVFRDGMDGSVRDTVVEGVPSLEGMKTTEANARSLEGLYAATKDVKSAIFWGDCPGLSYILRIPSAISTTWPDLDSYTVERLETDISKLTKQGAASSLNEKASDNGDRASSDEASETLGATAEAYSLTPSNTTAIIIGKNASTDGIHKSAKWDILEKLIEDNDMTVSYENEEYLVYTSCSE